MALCQNMTLLSLPFLVQIVEIVVHVVVFFLSFSLYFLFCYDCVNTLHSPANDYIKI